MGSDGDATYDAELPTLSYNAQRRQYLLIWSGTASTTGTQQENEIYGRLVDEVGRPIGQQFRISHMGPDGNAAYSTGKPSVTYNSVRNEYLVVWSADDNSGSMVDNDLEVYGQRISAAGELAGDRFRISQMTPDGTPAAIAVTPKITYNPQADEYLVVWHGNLVSDSGGRELEVFARRVSITGDLLGSQTQVSNQGPAGSSQYRAANASVIYNQAFNEYFVTWQGTEVSTSGGSPAPVADEAYGRRLSAALTPLTDPLRLSDMGPDGNPNYRASGVTVGYNTQSNSYLVIWSGDDNTAPLVDDEFEIFGQIVTPQGVESGANDFRISQMGEPGDTNYRAQTPAIAFRPDTNEFLVTWTGSDALPGVVAGKLEVFGQVISGANRLVGGALRISSMQPDDNAALGAVVSDAAYSTQRNSFLTVWNGDTTADGLANDEREVYVRLVVPVASPSQGNPSPLPSQAPGQSGPPPAQGAQPAGESTSGRPGGSQAAGAGPLPTTTSPEANSQKRAPRLSISLPKKTWPLYKHELSLSVRCEQGCTLTDLNLALRNGRRTTNLKYLTEVKPKGGVTKLRIELSYKAIVRLRKILQRHRYASVTIAVTARSSAGGYATVRQAVRITR